MACHRYILLLTAPVTLAFVYAMLLYKPSLYRGERSECFGHFYLCSYKRFLVDKRIYGNISFPHDIYNFSNLERFSSSFYKNNPQERLIEHKMQDHRDYMKNEFKDKWLDANLRYRTLSKNQSSLLCLFSPHKFFIYSFRFFKIITNYPVRLSFAIEETPISSVSHIIQPANIHASVSTQRTKAVCDTMHFSDGKYYVECPILEPKFLVSFWGTYMPPSVYHYICNRKDNWLLKECNNTYFEKQGLMLSTLNYPNLDLQTCSSHKSVHDNGFWIKIKEIWHYATPYCFYPFRFKHSTKECLQTKRVIMIGDSHMNYRRMALSQYEILNSTFIHITVSSQFAEVLKDDILTLNSSDDVVVVMNTGHWSVRYLDVATYISDMVQSFNTISSILKMNPAPQLIWVEITAMPYNNYHFRARTTAMVAALNDWTNYHMRKLGVDIVPAFNISLPMNEHTRDGAHYKELLEDDAYTKADQVSVGGAIDSVLIHTICPDP